MSRIALDPDPNEGSRSDARSALEKELDPKAGQRGLASGVLAFRVGSLFWMVTFNLISGGFSRPWLAYASFVAAGAWTAWLVLHPDDQTHRWALGLDLALTTYLILVSAYVVPPQGVISPHRLFFATAYPVSTPLMWGMSKRVWGGLGAGAVLSIALFLTRPLNHITISRVSDVIGVANGSAYFLIGGYTLGAIAVALDRSAASVRRAVAVAMEEQDRARWADTVHDLHDSVLNGLGILSRKLREIVSDPEASAESRLIDEAGGKAVRARLETLAAYASDQEQSLRDWIMRDRQIAAGMANLGDRLKETRTKVPGIDVQVISAGRIQVPDGLATELCAAVKEALQNVAEHAETDRAFVFAEVEDGWLLTSVRDHGKGYNPSDLPPPNHMGLAGMRQRVEGLGGKMKETSAPGAGTIIEFRIPADPAWIQR